MAGPWVPNGILAALWFSLPVLSALGDKQMAPLRSHIERTARKRGLDVEHALALVVGLVVLFGTLVSALTSGS